MTEKNLPDSWLPPPPPAELVGVWEELEPKLREDAQMRAAVLWVLHGETEATAAERVGISRFRLNHWMRKISFSSKTWMTDRLVSSHKRVSILALEELERRMSDPETLKDTKQFHPMTLNALAGTSTDKVSKREQWSLEKKEVETSYASALERVAQALAEGKIDLRIEVTPREKAIDVTPHTSVLDASTSSGDALPIGSGEDNPSFGE